MSRALHARDAPGGRLWLLALYACTAGETPLPGAFPDVTLKRCAREADDMRKLSRTESILAPGAKRRRGARAETFEAVATEWLELQSKALSAEDHFHSRHAAQELPVSLHWQRRDAMTAQELLATLRRIEARGRHETAHRVRALAAGCFATQWPRAACPTM